MMAACPSCRSVPRFVYNASAIISGRNILTPSLHRPAKLAVATLCILVPASGALAAQASAATISANRACYVNANPGIGAPMTITGGGFTPGDPISVSGSTVFASATADANGNFAVTTNAPILPTIFPASRSTTLTAQDEYTGVSAQVVVRSANLAVSEKPGSVRHVSRQKVTFTFSGFTPGKHIYAHYLRKKVVARMKFGKASGPCGTLRQKALMYPGGHPGHDSYTVTFESSKRYSKKAFPRVTEKLEILRF